MNKKGLNGWTWFWIILVIMVVGGGSYSYQSYSIDDYEEEEDPYDYCYDVYDILCNCDANYYNCNSFPTKADAQECYGLCNCLGKGDVHELDRDKDGLACEWNN